MSKTPVVDADRTWRWLARHGQSGTANLGPLLRTVARQLVDPGEQMSDDDLDLVIEMASDQPDWLAIRTLADGRFAGVMPLLFGAGRLGVNAPPDSPLYHPQLFTATWDYTRAIDAILALEAWDGVKYPEPGGFARRCGAPRIQFLVLPACPR